MKKKCTFFHDERENYEKSAHKMEKGTTFIGTFYVLCQKNYPFLGFF